MRARPEIIGHRGASAERPENSLAAFLRTLAVGADGIELDVHATRDGVVVVHHDAIIFPDAGARRSSTGVVVAEATLSDIRAVRVRGEPVPTLSEVLEAVGDRATVYIEIKGHGIESHVVEAIRRSPAPERCAVHSFDHVAAAKVRTLAPDIAAGILLTSYLIDPTHALAAVGARDLWQNWEFVDESLVCRIHNVGGRVIAWTPRHAPDLLTLASDGVDGVCVDDPAHAVALFGNAP